jgi:hypothetical protein
MREVYNVLSFAFTTAGLVLAIVGFLSVVLPLMQIIGNRYSPRIPFVASLSASFYYDPSYFLLPSVVSSLVFSGASICFDYITNFAWHLTLLFFGCLCF